MEELHDIIKGLNSNRAPGVDGFNGGFYRTAWHIIVKDLLGGVNNFLKSGSLLRQVNHILLCLIPEKVITALAEDYRPIVLCNVVYRILSKLLANRLKPLMPKLIDMNQSAFIPGCRITDSILLAHEICHNLHSGQGRARMCIRLDLSKAYDSISRQFICDVLLSLGFDSKWIRWLKACMNPSFALQINEERS